MINHAKLRKLFEGRTAKDEKAGRLQFVEDVHLMLGLVEEVKDAAGNHVGFERVRDEYGRPKLAEGRARPEEFSIQAIARAIFTEQQYDQFFNPDSGADRRQLIEAGPGLDPTAFLNINTFSLTTAGLVEAAILERFQNVAFIGDQLVTVRPTRKNGEKMIGITGIGRKAQTRKINEPHTRAGFGEHYVTTNENVEKGLAVEIAQETVFFDLTGDVLNVANSVGDELGYEREISIIDMVLGVSTAPQFIYNGSTISTYETAGTYYVNDHVNAIEDQSDLDNSLTLFTNMRDPATSKRVLVQPTTIVHSPAKESKFHHVLNSTELREVTNSNTTTLSPPNPRTKGWTLLSSVIFRDRADDADGLNLSTADANGLWLQGDFKRCFSWQENWPLRVRQASPTEYVMLDRGLIAAYFANYRGVGAVVSPWHVVRNKNA
jgi:hypothetical protein